MSLVDTTSWRLIRAAAAGSVTDREGFAVRYQPAVRAFFSSRWRRSPLAGNIDDAVQEVFVECMRAGGVLERADADRPGGFRALFFGVLRNIAARHEKRAGVARGRGSMDIAPDSLASADASASTLEDRRWAQQIVAEVVRRYAEAASAKGEDAMRRCELLRLRFQEDMPIRAIADAWKVDAAGLHHQYATAREEFARMLREVLAERAPAGEREQLLRRVLQALG